MENDPEYQKMQSEHLRILARHGLHFLSTAQAAADLLKDEAGLSDDEKNECLKILIDALDKHVELIKWSIKEHQDYIIADRQDNNQNP